MRRFAVILVLLSIQPRAAIADPLYDRMVDGALDYFVDACLNTHNHGEAFNKVMEDFGKTERWEHLRGDGGHKLLEVKSPMAPLSAFISNDATEGARKLCAVAFPAAGKDAIYSVVAAKLKSSVGFAGGLDVTDIGPAFIISKNQQVYLDDLDGANDSGQRVIVISRMKGN